MTSLICKILTLFIICMALQDGFGLPLSDQPELPVQTPLPHRIRTKRCSCNSWDDEECIYFCHLDIIWINTPSKLLPYGLGSPLSRRRRSVNRCKCLNSADKTCISFCYKSSEDPKNDVMIPLVESASRNSNKLLESFSGSVVSSKMAMERGMQSSKKNPSAINKLTCRTRR